MKKFVGVLVVLILGLLALGSLISTLVAVPEYFSWVLDRIAWLRRSLDYEQQVLVGAGLLAIACWTFDAEFDRIKGIRKIVVGASFVCVLAAAAVLLLAFDRLDVDPWPELAIADNTALAVPAAGGDGKNHHPAKSGDGEGGTSDPAAAEGQAIASSGSGSEFEAFGLKDESGSSKCTCTGPGYIPPSPPSRGAEEASPPPEEELGGFDEEAAEMAEEEQEAREEAAEEAEFEREFEELEAE